MIPQPNKQQQIDDFKQHLVDFIKRHDPLKVPKKTAKELIDETWPKKLGPWPQKNQWWQGKKWLQELSGKYQKIVRCRIDFFNWWQFRPDLTVISSTYLFKSDLS